MADLSVLAKRMRKKAKELPKIGHELAIKVVVKIVTDLATTTPADESTALSNWQVNIGSPATADRAAYYLGTKGSTRGLSAGATIDAAKSALGAKKPGQSIFLSNLTPYITKLNGGTSRQAPAGFVERSVLLGRLVVRGKL